MFAAIFDSPAEIGIVLLVILLLFGGAQLPKLAKNIGKAQKEFKDGLSEGQRADSEEAKKAAELAAAEAKVAQLRAEQAGPSIVVPPTTKSSTDI